MKSPEQHAVNATMNCKPAVHQGHVACAGCIADQVRAAVREALEDALEVVRHNEGDEVTALHALLLFWSPR